MTRMEVDKNKPRDTKTHPQTNKQVVPGCPSHLLERTKVCYVQLTVSCYSTKPNRGKTYPPTRKYKGREISVTLLHGLSFKA